MTPTIKLLVRQHQRLTGRHLRLKGIPPIVRAMRHLPKKERKISGLILCPGPDHMRSELLERLVGRPLKIRLRLKRGSRPIISTIISFFSRRWMLKGTIMKTRNISTLKWRKMLLQGWALVPILIPRFIASLNKMPNQSIFSSLGQLRSALRTSLECRL